MNSQEKLTTVLPIIRQAINGQNLSTDETTQALETIFIHDHAGFHFTAFMSALHAKGETPEELLGIINTFKKLSVKLSFKAPVSKTIDLSGTGGGTLKTINVSTAASFVVAAAGFAVPKASYFGVTSASGSADIFRYYGADITKLTKINIEEMVNSVGIAPFYVPALSSKLTNRSKLFKKVFIDHGLKVQSPFHLTTNAFSPFPIKYRLYGCYSEKYLERLAKLFSKLGFKKSLTVHSPNGFPEISNVGPTIICEQSASSIKLHNFAPSDFGVKTARQDQIIVKSQVDNIKIFESILKGESLGAKSDLVAINAGAAFYILGKVENFTQGTHLAQDIIKSGRAYQKLQTFVNFSKNH